MRGASRDQHHKDGGLAGRGLHRVEGVKLAVEFEDRLGDHLKRVMADRPAEHAAQHRGYGGNQRIAHGAVGFRQAHRDEKHIGRDRKHRAFHERDHGQCGGGIARSGPGEGPVVKRAKHRASRGWAGRLHHDGAARSSGLRGGATIAPGGRRFVMAIKPRRGR
ncbi:hypothetical protein GALL_489100 [mine drainage metagenome]|uniref:Uncharacterized protein n=1 Tax=mine drainage metagenome TaxID=410659 RepID=A0A1J5PCX2_9ZZZZ